MILLRCRKATIFYSNSNVNVCVQVGNTIPTLDAVLNKHSVKSYHDKTCTIDVALYYSNTGRINMALISHHTNIPKFHYITVIALA